MLSRLGDHHRVARDRGQELAPAEGQQHGVSDRRDRRRARDVAQERDLAEAVARGAQRPDGLPTARHLDRTRLHDVERLAGVALADD